MKLYRITALTLLSFLIVGVFVACMFPKAGISPNKGKLHEYLALGDQYVLGEGVDEKSRWPIQLENALRSHEYHITYPTFVADKKFTIKDLLTRLDEEDFNRHYDLVSIQIGVNDEYHKKPIATFKTEYATLLAEAVKLAGNKHGRVFVLSIPDWSVTPFAKRHDNAALELLAENINKYNAAIKQEVINIKGHYVDITEISRRAPSEPHLVSPDGLHPSADQYKIWVEKKIYPVVVEALNTHRN